MTDSHIELYPKSIKKVEIPEDYDYCVIEIRPDDYESLIRRLRDACIEDDTINKLAFNKAIRNDIEYSWKSKKLRKLNSTHK